MIMIDSCGTVHCIRDHNSGLNRGDLKLKKKRLHEMVNMPVMSYDCLLYLLT